MTEPQELRSSRTEISTMQNHLHEYFRTKSASGFSILHGVTQLVKP